MNSYNEILSRQYEIHELTRRKSSLTQKSGFNKRLSLSELNRRLERLEDFQFDSIDAYLKTDDASYRQLIAENHELLKSPRIHFTVYSSDFMLFSTYTKKEEGSIYPNGYSYSHASKSKLPFLFDSYRFPKSMAGNVDYWGRLKLETTSTGFSFTGQSLPRKFLGRVEADGKIFIDNIENEYEGDSNGKLRMGKLIANHFEYDEDRNIAFQNNRQALTSKIHAFWDGLK